jgi:hypothetical protein
VAVGNRHDRLNNEGCNPEIDSLRPPEWLL